MLVIILLITLMALTILFIGFFEIKIPFVSNSSDAGSKLVTRRDNKHARKILRKRILNDQIHKGFVKLPT